MIHDRWPAHGTPTIDGCSYEVGVRGVRSRLERNENFLERSKTPCRILAIVTHVHHRSSKLCPPLFVAQMEERFVYRAAGERVVCSGAN